MKQPGWEPSVAQVVVFSFTAFILVGTALLALPACRTGAPHALVDDLFTATSAVCVTGLMTLDLGSSYSPTGLAVLLLLIQVGGLGYMALYSLGLIFVGRRLSLRNRVRVMEALDQPGLAGLRSYLRGMLALTLAAEALGLAILATQTVPELGWGRGLASAAFFAVCALNNAGFSYLPDGLARWQGNPVFLLALSALIVFGGLGYNVARELVDRHLLRKPPRRRWDALINIVLLGTMGLLAAGTVAIWVLEHANPRTLAPLAPGLQGLNAFFMAVQARTTGFNSIDTGAMTRTSQVLMIAMMFVGTGPGGTGGGLKLTTAAILGATVWAAVRGQDDVVLPGHRLRLADDVVHKAVAALMLSLLICGTATCVIGLLEPAPLLAIAFEVVSAFATAGLSMGITPHLGTASKLVLVATMLAGRVGVMMLVLAVVPRREPSAVRYAEESLMVG